MPLVQGEGFFCIPDGQSVGHQRCEFKAVGQKNIPRGCQVFAPVGCDTGDEVCILTEEGFVFNGIDVLVRNAKSQHSALLSDQSQTIVEGFHLVAGFSGHGFMHGPVSGKLMADFHTSNIAYYQHPAGNNIRWIVSC